MENRTIPIIYALLAAVFYAVKTPLSKLLLADVPVTFMAAYLYLGAGIGVGLLYVLHERKGEKSGRLTKKELPYTFGMILLDILAPIFLMLGIKYGTAANASLLGNFEIVATTLMALVIFKETVSRRLWTAIALMIGETLPGSYYAFFVMLLGFVSYGLSIFLYIRAQKSLGAAKTSAYYAVAPFVLCPHRGKADLGIFCGIADYDGGNGIRRHRYHSQKSCTPASAYLHTYA